MGRPETIPMKAWNTWHDLFVKHGPDAMIAGEAWIQAAKRNGLPSTRQALAPYLQWLDDAGYIQRVRGGFTLAWGFMDTSVANPDGLFVTRPDGVIVQVLSAEMVRELGLWSDEGSEDDPDGEWEPMMALRFSTRNPDPMWGAYLRKKADYMRTLVTTKAMLKPMAGPPKKDRIGIHYLEDVHWYFLNNLGYKVGDLVDLDTWRLILAHDFESVILDENARKYHDSDAVSVFSDATYLAASLGLIKIEPGGVRLLKAPVKTVKQPVLKPSAKNLLR